MLSSGTGEFDEERLLQELPAALHLPERRVKAAIEAAAGDRKRNVLVQAVSLLRQRKLDEVVKSLNNLLACNKVRSEVFSLLCLFCCLPPQRGTCSGMKFECGRTLPASLAGFSAKSLDKRLLWSLAVG